MKWTLFISVLFLLSFNGFCYTHKHDSVTTTDSLTFSGQASIWTLYNDHNKLPLWLGGRYLPQLNYEVGYEPGKKFDAELSANISGTGGFLPFKKNTFDGSVKLYRGWIRYSTNQLELRLGLQKINFGSASMIRPLMWFDRIDPRDPLQLTDGVWGLLGRYYFLNNANIWLWGLYGNEQPSVWEAVNTNAQIPEFGGRVQLPVKRGEIGFSYHHRTADATELINLIGYNILLDPDVPENKYGIDGKFDFLTGLWFEASWTKKERNLELLSNQHLLNLGTDYTFGIGNGLNVILEHLYMSYDKDPFKLSNSVNFTALSLNYPIGLSDNLSTIIYYDWLHKSTYNFLRWQKQLEEFTFYAMLFINPENNQLPSTRDSYNLMGGKGIQIMIVYNH